MNWLFPYIIWRKIRDSNRKSRKTEWMRARAIVFIFNPTADSHKSSASQCHALNARQVWCVMSDDSGRGTEQIHLKGHICVPANTEALEHVANNNAPQYNERARLVITHFSWCSWFAFSFEFYDCDCVRNASAVNGTALRTCSSGMFLIPC